MQLSEAKTMGMAMRLVLPAVKLLWMRQSLMVESVLDMRNSADMQSKPAKRMECEQGFAAVPLAYKPSGQKAGR